MTHVRFLKGAREEYFLSIIASRLAVVPIEQSSPVGTRIFFPDREADHSPPHSGEVKNEWSYTSILRIGLDGAVLS
jgi:hypothetical protein